MGYATIPVLIQSLKVVSTNSFEFINSKIHRLEFQLCYQNCAWSQFKCNTKSSKILTSFYSKTFILKSLKNQQQNHNSTPQSVIILVYLCSSHHTNQLLQLAGSLNSLERYSKVKTNGFLRLLNFLLFLHFPPSQSFSRLGISTLNFLKNSFRKVKEFLYIYMLKLLF